jgi:hypothetical protein
MVMMRFIRLALAFAFAATLAACQTTGGPSAGTAALLEQQGFKQQPADEFNKDLTADDIRTTAFYLCDLPGCGGLALVLFGNDLEAVTMLKEIDQLERQGRRQGLRSSNRLLRSAGVKELSLVNYAVFAAPDGGRGLMLDLVGKVGNDKLFLKLTVIYRNSVGRLVVAASSRRAVAERFGGRAMLE